MKSWLLLFVWIAAVGCSGGGDDCANNAGDAGPPACGTDTWTTFGENFFSDHCSECHGGFDQPTIQASAAMYSSAISSGAMPRDGNLSSCDRERAVAYLNCGAP
jgi:hypothetical protein